MNRTFSHTLGPWRIANKQDVFCEAVVVDDQNGNLIADCNIFPTSEKENMANAHLIAAAPDLLAALETIACQSLGDDWTAEQAIKFVKDHAREAIAKARAAKAKGEDSP